MFENVCISCLSGSFCHNTQFKLACSQPLFHSIECKCNDLFFKLWFYGKLRAKAIFIIKAGVSAGCPRCLTRLQEFLVPR